MLVLSRKTEEAISFPSLGITIKVVKLKGKTVSIGIDAPDQVQVLRGELVESATSFNDPQPIPGRPFECLTYGNSSCTATV